MKRGWPIVFLLVLLGAGLLAGLALARPAEGPATPTWYYVDSGTVFGDGYRLASGNWQVYGVARGEGLSLRQLGGSILQGAGCCCTYLPCTYR